MAKFNKPLKDDPWTLYTISGCCFCNDAIEFFKNRGMEIINDDVHSFSHEKNKSQYYVRVYKISDKEKKEFIEFININHKTFPIVFEKDKLFGGLDRLIEDFSNPQ